MNISRWNPWNWFESENAPVRREPSVPAATNEGTTSVHQLRSDIDRLFESMLRNFPSPFHDFGMASGRTSAALFRPRLDLAADEKAYTISVEVPGVEPESVSLELQDRKLVIQGEKKNTVNNEEKGYYRMERVYGSFQRVLALPDDADVDNIAAAHKDGVLTITVPRSAQPVSSSRKISILKS